MQSADPLLPLEILQQIYACSGHISKYAFQFVAKSFNYESDKPKQKELLEVCVEHAYFDLVKFLIDSLHYPLVLLDMQKVINKKDVSIVSWLIANGLVLDKKYMRMACKVQCLPLVEYFYSRGLKFGTKQCALAVYYQTEDITSWAESKKLGCYGSLPRVAHREKTQDEDLFACENAAWYGDLRLLKAILSRTEKWDDRICSAAAEQGHITILKWAYREGRKMNAHIGAAAVDGNKIKVLHWLKKHGYPLGSFVMARAVIKDNPQVLNFLCEKNRLPATCIRLAVKLGKEYLLKPFFEGKFEEQYFITACQEKHLLLCQWLCKLERPGPALLAKYGFRELFSWLHATSDNPELLRKAFQEGNDEYYLFLEKDLSSEVSGALFAPICQNLKNWASKEDGIIFRWLKIHKPNLVKAFYADWYTELYTLKLERPYPAYSILKYLIATEDTELLTMETGTIYPGLTPLDIAMARWCVQKNLIINHYAISKDLNEAFFCAIRNITNGGSLGHQSKEFETFFVNHGIRFAYNISSREVLRCALQTYGAKRLLLNKELEYCLKTNKNMVHSLLRLVRSIPWYVRHGKEEFNEFEVLVTDLAK